MVQGPATTQRKTHQMCLVKRLNVAGKVQVVKGGGCKKTVMLHVHLEFLVQPHETLGHVMVENVQTVGNVPGPFCKGKGGNLQLSMPENQ